MKNHKPARTVATSVLLPPELLIEIARLCESTGTKRADVIRQLITRGLNCKE